ncbi:hypothetical protein Tco_0416170, partial [Tanacetum coccineum]
AGQKESNQNAGTKDKIDAGDSEKEGESNLDCLELPIWHSYSSTNPFASKSNNKIGGPREEEQFFLDDLARLQRQEKEANKERKLKLSGSLLNKKLRTWLLRQELLSLAVLTFLVPLAQQLKLAVLTWLIPLAYQLVLPVLNRK